MIGLGRMGSNMVRRLLGAGHDCIYYDRSMQAVTDLAGVGGHGATSVPDFVAVASVPAPVLTSALFARFASRGEADFQNRLLSAKRSAFGGHRESSAG
jgi:6-phosphogluconate dehydrogenase